MAEFSSNIVATEVETFFKEKEDSFSVSIVNLGEYPIPYYTSESSLDDLRATDVVTHFAHELTTLIHQKTKESKYNVSITTHFFQYIINHFGNDEKMLKVVMENLIRSDLLILLSQGSNPTLDRFTSILKNSDSSVVYNHFNLASIFSFAPNDIDMQPFVYNPYHHLKSNVEFSLVNAILEKGFVIPSEGFLSFSYIKERYAVDAITRIMDGTEFYDDEKQYVFKKLMRYLLSVFSLLKTRSRGEQ